MAPLLVLVSGPPGAGKTTLARMIGADLGLAVLGKDTIKEALRDAVGAESVARSTELGAVAVRVLYALAKEQLDLGVSIVVDHVFPLEAASEVVPLVERADARLVHCRASEEILERRALLREGAATRHDVHRDRERVPFDWARYAVMELDVPTLFLDTSDGYDPDYPTVLHFIERGSRR